MAHPNDYDIPIYSRAARRFHWWVALFITIQFALGFYMTYRGYEMVYTNEAARRRPACSMPSPAHFMTATNFLVC